MGDRQDIDALLIGALYGELDADDQARLDAHLTAHPGDRAAMDELARTRAHVREGLARLPEAEPAPAISTLLLREAARRAPRRAPARDSGGGVLGWLAGLFRPVAAHPALAGALTLAVVAGTAGILHERGKVGSQPSAVATIDETTAAPAEPADGDSPRAEAPAPVADPGARPTEAYQVGLLDSEGSGSASSAGAYRLRQDVAGGRGATLTLDGKAADTGGKAVGVPAGHHRVAVAGAHGTGSTQKAPARPAKKGALHNAGYVEVQTREPQLKSLDDDRAPRSRDLAKNEVAKPAPRVSAGMAGDAVAAPAPPPPPAQGQAPAYDKNKDATLDEWAKVQHARLVGLVRDGKCVEAGKLGNEIAQRAPEYYAAHVEHDRAVRQCKQYIDQEKRKSATERSKSRARNAPEADMAAPVN
jgi:hypothetical protein